MNIPADLKYTENDEWIRIDGNIGWIGITDYAQEQLSDIVFVEYALAEGEEAAKGDEFATVESVKAAAESYLPASGTLLENNELLEDAPETINSDPYGDAWMIKVEFSDVAELDGLLDAAAYGKFLEERDN